MFSRGQNNSRSPIRRLDRGFARARNRQENEEEIQKTPENIVIWSRPTKDMEKQIAFFRRYPHGKEFLKMITEKMEWMNDVQSRRCIKKVELINSFGMFRHEIAKTIEAFGSLM